MKRKINKAKGLQIAAWSLAGLTLGAGLVYFNFIEKDKFQTLSIGAECPDFLVKTYVCENGSFDYSAEFFNLYKNKGKVVVVNLWETWCNPCIKELSEFNEFYEEYSADVEVLALAGTTSSVSEIKDWLNNEGWRANEPEEDWRDFTFTIACQISVGEVSYPLGCLGALPRTVVVDRNGIVRYAQDGEMSKEQLEEIVLPLL